MEHRKGAKLESIHPGMVKVELKPVPSKLQPFQSNDEGLESALQMLAARHARLNAQDGRQPGVEEFNRLCKTEESWTRFWHRAFRTSGPSVSLCRHLRQHRLTQLEREILIILLLEKVALLSIKPVNCASLLEILALPPGKLVETLRLVSREGRLFKEKLIFYEDSDEEILDRKLVVDPELVDLVLREGALVQKAGP